MKANTNSQDREKGIAHQKSEQFRIGYLSDVEGHWDYFLEYVERSKVLDWEDTTCPPSCEAKNINMDNILFQRLILRPNTHFVYGGDTVDKGPGDIRLVRALVSLKKRYPTRVDLLVGNRDLNKLRLPSELSEPDMERDIKDIEGPFWNKSAKSLKRYLEDLQGESTPSGGVERSLEELNTRVERLRYIFQHTLGCPDTFEFRREEVGLLTRIYGEYPPKSDTHDATPRVKLHSSIDEANSADISDEEVVESFLYEMSLEGSLRQYLNLSSIAAIVGNTIFVHGAIDRLTMKFVPSLDTKFQLPASPPPPFSRPQSVTPTDGRFIDDVHEWVKSLNGYLTSGLDDFTNRPLWNDDRTSRGGEAVLAIQCRPAMWGRSVVCNSYADGGVITTADAEEVRRQALHSANEQQLDPLVFEGLASNVMDPEPARWLLDQGIRRVLVGHKPTGDCPAVLSSKYTGVETIAVDTSYSDRNDLDDNGTCVKKFGENRGHAIAVVEINGEDAFNNWLETSGVLACGNEYSNRFPLLANSTDDDEEYGDHLLGTMVSEGWWIKAAVPPNYHLVRGSGRLVEYDTRPMQSVIDDARLQINSES